MLHQKANGERRRISGKRKGRKISVNKTPLYEHRKRANEISDNSNNWIENKSAKKKKFIQYLTLCMENHRVHISHAYNTHSSSRRWRTVSTTCIYTNWSLLSVCQYHHRSVWMYRYVYWSGKDENEEEVAKEKKNY